MPSLPNHIQKKVAVIIWSVPLLLITGCASYAPSVRMQGEPVANKAAITPGARTSDVLTRAEIRQSSDLANGSLYDAVMRLRVEYFRARVPIGGEPLVATPSVFINGTFNGGVEVLHSIPVRVVEEIRFVRSQDAMLRYGSDFRSGVILISTTQPR